MELALVCSWNFIQILKANALLFQKEGRYLHSKQPSNYNVDTLPDNSLKYHEHWSSSFSSEQTNKQKTLPSSILEKSG